MRYLLLGLLFVSGLAFGEEQHFVKNLRELKNPQEKYTLNYFTNSGYNTSKPAELKIRAEKIFVEKCEINKWCTENSSIEDKYIYDTERDALLEAHRQMEKINLTLGE